MVEEQRGKMVGVSVLRWARDVSKWDDTRSARRPREIFGVGFGEPRAVAAAAGSRTHGRAAQPRSKRLSLVWSGRVAGAMGLLALRALWFNAYGKGLRADQGPTSEEPLSASASAAGRKWSEMSWRWGARGRRGTRGVLVGGAGDCGLWGGSMETCLRRRKKMGSFAAWARAKKDCSSVRVGLGDVLPPIALG